MRTRGNKERIMYALRTKTRRFWLHWKIPEFIFLGILSPFLLALWGGSTGSWKCAISPIPGDSNRCVILCYCFEENQRRCRASARVFLFTVFMTWVKLSLQSSLCPRYGKTRSFSIIVGRHCFGTWTKPLHRKGSHLHSAVYTRAFCRSECLCHTSDILVTLMIPASPFTVRHTITIVFIFPACLSPPCYDFTNHY